MKNLTIYFAGGCFWGTEKFFSLLKGVTSHEVGYVNGGSSSISYEEVCRGSGHAEAVKLVVDIDTISLKELVGLFLEIIDPFSINKQGNDIGIQYRSGIYVEDKALVAEIEGILGEFNKGYDKEFAIEVGLVNDYCTGEEYHQNYLGKNPRGYCHIGIDKFLKAMEFNQNK